MGAACRSPDAPPERPPFRVQHHGLWVRAGSRQLDRLSAAAGRRADLSPTDDAERSSIVATRFADTDVGSLAQRLNEAGVVVSARRNVLRFSPHLYNNADDIQQALMAIDRCLT